MEKILLRQLLIITFLLTCKTVYPVDLYCYSNKCPISAKEIIDVTKNYLHSVSCLSSERYTKYKYIINIDYNVVNDTNIYQVNEDMAIRNVYNKVPDCFIFGFDRLILIYNSGLKSINDTIWINKIIDLAKIHFNIPRSYDPMSFGWFYLGDPNIIPYEPPIITYKVFNNKIISKKEFSF